MTDLRDLSDRGAEPRAPEPGHPRLEPDPRSDTTCRTPRTVLIVCHANTARSVIAHVLLERMLVEHNASAAIRVRSGGIAAYARDGMIPSLDARIVLREVGVHLAEDALASTDLKRHRHLIAEADLILTMTAEQKRAIAAFGESHGRPLFTLREFAGDDGDIVDPAGQGEEAFRHSRDEIARCLERSIARVLEMGGGRD